MSLQSKTIHSFKWSLLAELSNSVVLFVVYIVTAKLLKPEDFGIITAATILISLSQILRIAGLAKTLIQRQDRIEESATVVFWANLVFGFVLYVILFFTSPWVAVLFKDPRVENVLKVLSLLIVFSSLSSVQLALFQKELQFKKIFWIRILTVGIPGVTSISLAYFGYGYWALVAGGLIGQFFQVLLLWIMCPWRPKFWFDFKLFKDLSRFGIWVLFSSLSAWFYLWADSMIVGIYLDSHTLGIYRTGNYFTTMVFGLFFGPLIPVLYSAFSKISHDREKLKLKHEIVVKLFSMISLPIGFGLFALQDKVAMVFFGSHWQGIALVIGVLGLAHSFSWVIGANGEVYRAIGRPDIETKVVTFTLVFYLAAYFISIQQGLIIFIWTRLSLTCLAMLVSFYFAKKILLFPWIKWFTLTISSFFSAFVMYFILIYINEKYPDNIKNFVFLILIGICIYFILIYLLEHKFIRKEILTLIPFKQE